MVSIVPPDEALSLDELAADLALVTVQEVVAVNTQGLVVPEERERGFKRRSSNYHRREEYKCYTIDD